MEGKTVITMFGQEERSDELCMTQICVHIESEEISQEGGGVCCCEVC